MSSLLQLFEQQSKSSVVHAFFFYLIPLFIVIFVFKWFTMPPAVQKKRPPSPPKLPIIGNLHQLGNRPHHTLQSLAQRHGRLMLLQFGRVPVLIVSSAEAAREIMKTHDVIFANRPRSSVSERLLYNGKDLTVAPYGEHWRQMRSICVLQLLSNKRVESFRSVRDEETALLVKRIKESSVVNLSEMLMSLTNDVVCRAALGKKYSEGDGGRKLREMLWEFVSFSAFYTGDYIPWLSWLSKVNGLDSRVEKLFNKFDSFLDGVVEEHMDRKNREDIGERIDGGKEERKDFVDILLEHHLDSKDGFSIDRDGVKALILDMFAAGTDTTYTVLEWGMTELLKHPRVMKELQNEVREITGCKQDITEQDLAKMHYLKAVIKETLRLHPPLPLLVPRQSTEDVEVMGYHIAVNTTVIINVWAISRDPALWDEPGEFRPERFLKSSVDFKGQNFELIPFGAGRRGCPGTSFGTATIELVLASLVQKFDWALPGAGRAEDLDMTECNGVNIHRKTHLLAVATPHYSR